MTWGEVKGQISLNFDYHVNFKDVYTKFCVCAHKYKTYQTGFLFCRLGHAPGLGQWGTGGTQGIKQFLFLKHGHLAYQIDRNDEQNKMQVTFSS